MRVCYSDGYVTELPEGHPFPMRKIHLLRDLLVEEGTLEVDRLFEPEPMPWEQLATVHTATYLDCLRTGSFTRLEVRRMGFPWSEAMVRRTRLVAQGTLTAGRLALADGLAGNLAGGMHHGFPGHGEGFCLVNDVAAAVRTLQSEGAIHRAMLVDLDVHQGNGSARIFADDPNVFTFSMHGARNYPGRKETSSLDVGLPDGLGDLGYLDALDDHLSRALHAAKPDLVYYLAGVDPAAGDRYGRLALTPAGIAERDRFVLETLVGAGVPTAVVLSGGYAATPEATAALHAIVFREAVALTRSAGSVPAWN